MAAGAAVLLCGFAGSAQAANRTFVSGKGSDGNPCTLAAPCRSFAAAFLQTQTGGEIAVLDTAGYGGLNITRAVSIVNDGAGEASVQVGPGAPAITINASSSDVVHLRGLTIEGANVSQDGIQFFTGGSLTVLNCVIRHFTGSGIYVAPTTDMSFNILNTYSLDNGGHGIWVIPQGSGSAHGIIDRVTSSGNQYGIVVDSGGSGLPNTVTVSNSVISLNQYGFFTSSSSGKSATNTFLRDTIVAQNAQTGVGAQSGGGSAVLQLAGNVITANFNGVITQGTVESFGDNDINRNFIDFPTGNGNSGSLITIQRK